MANSIKVKARQTPVDIAIQQCGTLESVFDVANANNIGITDDLIAGSMIAYPDAVVADVAAFFKRYGLFPASANIGVSNLLPEGVEFWAIEYDFIVS